MAFALEGFGTIAQRYLSKSVSSFFYKKWTLGHFLGATTLSNENKDSLSIGRPNAGEVFGMVTPAQRKTLPTVNSYVPRIQNFVTNNTRTRSNSGRVALPEVASASTNSHGQATQFGAEFKWTHYDTPILIWHEDKIRAGKEGSKEGQSIAMGQLVEEATQVAYQDLVEKLANDSWTGSPGSQSTDLWDSLAGITDMTASTNTYAGVNRSVETQWASQLVSAATTADIVKNLDDVNLGNSAGTIEGVRVKGNGVNLCLTNSTTYRIYKSQILSNSNGGVVLQNGIPEMGKLGVTREVLQKDNCYIMYDPFCPTTTAVFLDTSTIKFIVHQDFNFSVKPFEDNTTKGIGKDAYDFSYVMLRAMLTNDSPKRAVRFSNIS